MICPIQRATFDRRSPPAGMTVISAADSSGPTSNAASRMLLVRPGRQPSGVSNWTGDWFSDDWLLGGWLLGGWLLGGWLLVCSGGDAASDSRSDASSLLGGESLPGRHLIAVLKAAGHHRRATPRHHRRATAG